MRSMIRAETAPPGSRSPECGKMSFRSYSEGNFTCIDPMPLRYALRDQGGRFVGDEEMIRSELVQQLSEENPGLALRDMEAIVSTFFDEITRRLSDDGRVELRGFGAFSTRPRDARTGRNPRTGELVEVVAKRVPYFKPGKEMRTRLNV